MPTASDAPAEEQSTESDWRPRLHFSLGITDFLYNWGFWKRKPSESSSRIHSPVKSNPELEQIELNQLQHSEVPISPTSPQSLTARSLSLSPPNSWYSSPYASLPRLKNLNYGSLKSPTQFFDALSVASFLIEGDSSHSNAGHNFLLSDAQKPTWCDTCGDLLFGLNGEHLRCQYCNYSCHLTCKDLVNLDCNERPEESEGTESVSDAITEAVDFTDSEAQNAAVAVNVMEASVTSSDSVFYESVPSMEVEDYEHLKLLLEEYNTNLMYPGLEMTLDEEGQGFRGFIRVHMNLCRPISVVAGTRPPSIYDCLKDDPTLERTLTSFYLPRDTVKALHVTSTTSAQEVIVSLLKKFKVVDNPRKFALYERFYENGETAKVHMRKLADNEVPLCMALQWSRDQNCGKMFVLQENDPGDIMWEAFTYPELANFLRILDREEEEYKRIVRQKYHFLAQKIQDAMDQIEPITTKKEETELEVP